MHRYIFGLFILLFFNVLVPPFALAEDADLMTLFTTEGITGTLIIAPLQGGTIFVHNNQRASHRFPVASTFKILNTLIALEEHVVRDDETLRWDGIEREFQDWNRDHTLESAFRTSCVWCYQELARRIGADNYRGYLERVDYGALSEPFDLTEFWLDGSLQISAAEQIEFLRGIYLRELPFSASAYDTLRHLMLTEQTPSYTLYAKTGWAARSNPGIGWYIGYAEMTNGPWFFALNIDVHDTGDLPLRQKIVRSALYAKSIIQ